MKIIVEEKVYDNVHNALRYIKETFGYDIIPNTNIIEKTKNILFNDYVIDDTESGKKIMYPKEPGTMFFIEAIAHTAIDFEAGAILSNGNKILDNDRATIIVYKSDTIRSLAIRTMKNIGAIIELPMDELDKYASRCLGWDWFGYSLQKAAGKHPESNEQYIVQYYKYLVRRRNRGTI